MEHVSSAQMLARAKLNTVQGSKLLDHLGKGGGAGSQIAAQLVKVSRG